MGSKIGYDVSKMFNRFRTNTNTSFGMPESWHGAQQGIEKKHVATRQNYELRLVSLTSGGLGIPCV